MVSSAVSMSKSELVRALARIAREHASDPTYKAMRRAFPKSWPM